MKALLTVIYNIVASMSPAVRVVLALGSAGLALNTYFNSLWAAMFARIDTIVAGSTGSANFAPLGLLNYCFPLDTLLTFLVSYAALQLTCVGIRIIKSFVPTIA